MGLVEEFVFVVLQEWQYSVWHMKGLDSVGVGFVEGFVFVVLGECKCSVWHERSIGNQWVTGHDCRRNHY